MFRVMRERGAVESRGANVLRLLARLLTHNPLGPYNYFEAICVEVIGLCEKSTNALLLNKRRGERRRKVRRTRRTFSLISPFGRFRSVII